jgi:mRNA guanylyltransferase
MSVAKSALGKPVSDKSFQVEEMRRDCCKLCGSDRETFPGSQPVSLTRKNLLGIARYPYVVCEKSDGERHMLYVTKNECFLVDRKFMFYRVSLPSYFPSVDSPKTTLLDGELIEDDGKIRYLIYDAVCINGESIKDKPLIDRLQQVHIKIITPAKKPTNEKSLFTLYLKDFFDVKHCRYVVELSKRLPHYSDGLIFTPVRDAYRSGTCQKMLKWKPAELNTIDFVLELIMGATAQQFHGKLRSAAGGVQTFNGVWLAREGPMWSWLCENTWLANGKVVECGWDPNIHTFVPANAGNYTEDGKWVSGGGWVLHRIRDDRTTPNDINVVEKVKASIADAISLDDVESTLGNVKSLTKLAESAKKTRHN